MAYQPTASDLPPMSQDEIDYDASLKNGGQQSGGYQPTAADLPPPSQDELDLDHPYSLKTYLHKQIENISPKALRQDVRNISVLGRSTGQGLREMLQGIPGEAALNVLTAPARAASSAGILPHDVQQYVQQNRPEDVLQRARSAPSFVTPQESQTPAGQVGEFIGGTLPYLAVPGGDISKAPAFVERAVAEASPLARQLGLMGGRLGKGALVGAGTTAIAQPDEDLQKSLESGGALGAATSGVLGTLGASGKIAAKGLSKLFGGFGDPESIKATMKALQETGISLPSGEILESGPMTSLQRSLLHIPLTGIKKSYVGAANKVSDRAQDLLSKMQKTGSSEAQEEMQQSLRTLSKNRHQTKRDLYKRVDEYGDKMGYRLKSPEFDKTANSIRQEINDFHSGSPSSDMSEGESNLLKFLDKVKTTRVSDIQGIKDPSRTFKQAKIYNKRINNELQNAIRSGDKNSISKYGALDSALRSDVKNQISDIKDPKMSSMFSTAEKYYKKKILPIDSDEIKKFLNKDVDTDKLYSSFLKSGQIERPKLLHQLVSKMNGNQKDAFGVHYLTRNLKSSSEAFDFNPASIATNYQKLKPAMKKLLFDSSKRKELDNLSMIMKKVGGQGNQMFSPQTGITWSEMAGKFAPAAAVGSAALHEKAGKLALGGVLSAIGVGRALRSPKLAEFYMKQLEKGSGLSSSAQRHLSILPFLATELNKDKK